MDKASIEKTVDAAFASCLEEIQPLINRELYPAAFANEYSWLRVKAVFNLQNEAISKALKKVLIEILVEKIKP